MSRLSSRLDRSSPPVASSISRVPDPSNGAGARASMLTVRECLAFEPLAEAQVVGGHAGLDRPIRWVHVVEVPDIIDCLVGGELVLTTGISISSDPALQRELIPAMDAIEAAGLVFALGPYIQQVPPVMIAEADRCNLPILAIPWSVNFGDITKVLATDIIQRQHAILERNEQIHQALTQLVLHGGDLEDLAEQLAHLLGRSVVIVDPAMQCLAAHLTDDASPEARGLIADGNARPMTWQQLLSGQAECQEGTEEHGSSVVASPSGALGAPIMVAERLHGYLWLDGNHRPPAPSDLVAVEHGATVAALMMYKDEAVRQAERRLEQHVLDGLFDSDAVDERVLERAARFGLSINQPYVVLVIDPGSHDLMVAAQVARTPVSRFDRAARVHPRRGYVTVILPGSQRERGEQLAEQLLATYAQGDAEVTIGMSAVVPTLAGIGDAYRDARDALRIGRHVDPEARLHRIEDVGMLREFVARLGRGPALGAPRAVAQLADYDAAHEGSLLETLDAYLRHDGRVSAAARALGVHRHTLLYRLSRISEVTGLTLSPAVLLDLRLGLLVYRLTQPAERDSSLS